MSRIVLPEHSTIHRSAIVKDKVDIEHPVHISPRAEFHSGKIGRYTFINIDTIIYDNVDIGRYSSLARRCQIAGAEHPMHYLSTSFFQVESHVFPDDPAMSEIRKLDNARAPGRRRADKTVIGNDVWVGADVLILKGVMVGDGAIIAAGAVVTKDVPPYAIVGGNPSKLIRYRFGHKIIAELIELQWWNRPIDELSQLPFDDVQTCIDLLRKAPGS